MKRGDVLGWVILDADTGEWIYRCATRAEARELALGANALIAQVVVA